MGDRKQGTVQTLLAAKKNTSHKGSNERPSKEAKRTHSDVSEDNSIDLGVIQNDLDTIKGSLQGVVKKPDLDEAINQLVKTSDLENMVTTIVTKLVNSMKEEIEKKFEKTFREKIGKQQKAIEGLSEENEQLRELLSRDVQLLI